MVKIKLRKGMYNMKKSINIVVILAFIGVLFLGNTQLVSANGANFSVKGILPDNQKKEGVSYFDFELAPKEEKTIEVEVSNNSDIQQNYVIGVNTATTNMNGVIDYGESDIYDDTLSISMDEIATFEPNLTLDSGETKKVPIRLLMPDKKFEGILLGGISIAEVLQEQQETQIANQFSYSIALVLSQGDSVPTIDLAMPKVVVEQINRRNVISANIQNKSATIVNNLSVEARIYRDKKEKPLYYQEGEQMRMAPNSNFNFGVSTNNQPLKAGKYTMVVKATDGDQEWEWEKEFEIKDDEAQKLNKTAVELENDNLVLYLAIAAALVALVLIIVIVILIKKNRKKM